MNSSETNHDEVYPLKPSIPFTEEIFAKGFMITSKAIKLIRLIKSDVTYDEVLILSELILRPHNCATKECMI